MSSGMSAGQEKAVARRFRELPPREAAERRLATDPGLSAWVSANAGSGKTSILRNRVIRLLLAGVAPDRILCLTFTKAAAAEMQSRIFDELARWVSLDDAELSRAIADLTGEPRPAGADLLKQARQLFAEALETPGGLKIQTIHAFAERILHHFPIEAGVPVDFTVLEESEARALASEARQSVLARAAVEAHGPLARALDTLIEAAGLEGFSKAVGNAVARLTETAGTTDEAAIGRAYAVFFGVDPTESEAALEAAFRRETPTAAEARAFAERLRRLKPGQDTSKTITALEAFAKASDNQRLDAALDIVLTKERSLRAKLLEKPNAAAEPGIDARLESMKSAAATFLARRKSVRGFQRSHALRRFAVEVLAAYRRAKETRNALDFDDLIAALRQLLASGQAGWVMLKLDAAIEHILVDEAQDTTPTMWEIIQALAGDFFAGEGQVRRTRTLFVVGDEKQSIFSFQGADPAAFEATRRHFAGLVPALPPALREANLVQKPVRLAYSFRSSGDVLAAVDQVFAETSRAAGLTAGGEPIEHAAADDRFPGQVELWPVEAAPAAAARPADPDLPVDAVPEGDVSIRAAERIAEEIRGWIAGGARHARDGRPVRPGDILILVRHRNAFFAALLRELRLRHIPVAGADRLKLEDEIVIHDLRAAARAALQPEDDLTLATVLKSPFCGLDDAALETLCRHRPGSLRAAIGAAAGLATIDAWLGALEAEAGKAAPFAFFAGLLTAPCPARPGQSARSALLTRLGPDAADPIDAYLGEALAFAGRNPASLLGFLEAEAERETQIKRDLDRGEGQVRVMTVHGSKGLEARIVILADALIPAVSQEDNVFAVPVAGQSLLLWAGRRSDEPPEIEAERDRRRQRAAEEYRRLLYVGLTRAADRLIVAAYPRKRLRKDDPLHRPWHELVEEALAGHAKVAREPAGTGVGEKLVWRSSLPATEAAEEPAPPALLRDELPDWLKHPLPAETPTASALLPSTRRPEIEGSEAESSGLSARRRGLLLHRLFEHLPRVPADQQSDAGLAILRQAGWSGDAAEAAALIGPVLSALAAPEGARYFGPGSRAELALAGPVRLPDGRLHAVSGRIDRLAIAADGIDLLDIKTGRPRRAVEDWAILRQMALYAALAAALRPGARVCATVLWAETARFEPLPGDALEEALARIAREPFTAG